MADGLRPGKLGAATVGTLRFVEGAQRLERSRMKRLRLRRFEVGIVLRQPLERDARRGKIVLRELRFRQAGEQRWIVLKDAGSPP